MSDHDRDSEDELPASAPSPVLKGGAGGSADKVVDWDDDDDWDWDH